MAGSYQEIDPDGDLILILNPSLLVLKEAVRGARGEADSQPSCIDDLTATNSLDISGEPNISDESGLWGLTLEAISEPTIEESTTSKTASTFYRPSNGTILGSHTSAATTDEETLCQEVRIRVSSKHLTLASPIFKTMLQPKFKEGLQLHSHGYAELPLPDDNPAALLILLNLIHGQFRKVPRKIDLWMLTELAVLVDKYELLETTEMLLDYWLQYLKSTIPVVLNDDLLPWICISRVFRNPDIFEKVTKVAQLESEGLLEVSEWPIPEHVLKNIDLSRQTALAEIFAHLQSILERYQGSKGICRRGIECDGMVLGSLTIGLNAIGVLQPPDPPYNGYSVKGLSRNLKEMRVPQYCEISRDYNRRYDYERGGHCDGVKRSLDAKIDEVEQQLQGLKSVDELISLQALQLNHSADTLMA